MWKIIEQDLPQLVYAMLTYTIPLALISFFLGLIIAIVVALIRFLKPHITKNDKKINNILWFSLRLFCNFYVWLFRSTPLLVQLFVIFFGLPALGLKLDSFIAAIIAFSLNLGAYASETIRSALLSISKSQWEAAFTLCFSTPRTLLIIFPQVFRIALPPLSNEFLGLVKDTSLASTITIAEMFQVSQQMTAENYQPLLMYCLVGALYAIICTILSIFQHFLEKRSSAYLSK